MRIHEPLATFLAMEVVGRRRLDDLLERTIEREHMQPVYHGDFWVGNILRRASDGRLVLIDRERHPFGSRTLDGADFLLDFVLNERGRAFPAFDLKASAATSASRRMTAICSRRRSSARCCGTPRPAAPIPCSSRTSRCSRALFAGRLPDALGWA